MCGIAGIVGKCASEVHLGPMVGALARRGPDDHGVWVDPHAEAALGHTRLSIIDVSDAGHQPMTHGDGRFWITFNGEIYNFVELRRELEAEGAVFATQTDTEVILAGWPRWGVGTLRRLRGMFAFGLWDRQERRLVLARDRLGIKPLLFTVTPDGIAFASELKALLASGLVEPLLELPGVLDLLAAGSVCQPKTMVRGVRSLEPGTCLMVGPGNRQEALRYWDAAAAAANLRPELAKLCYADAVRRIRNLLEEACRYHLVADVPVGGFLSGGIDSTAITAMMSRHASSPVKSFSVGFDSTVGLQNELEPARLAANHIGCEHTEVILSGRDVEQAFDDLVRTIDQPSYDGANTYFVSRAARAAVKVTLSGLGGDELFAGYPHFADFQAASRQMPRPHDFLLNFAHRFRPNRWTYTAAFRCLSVVQRYASLRRGLADDEIAAALAPPLHAGFRPAFLEEHLKPLVKESFEPVSQVSLVECRHYLVDTLLRDADVMSMGHGLEVRPVMLDHVLVENAIALPPEFKIREGRHKAVLKDAVQDLLPPGLLARPKTGFELPLGHWLRTVLRERLRAALSSTHARCLFNAEFLMDCQRKIDEPRSARLLWTMLVLLTWMAECKIRFVDVAPLGPQLRAGSA